VIEQALGARKRQTRRPDATVSWTTRPRTRPETGSIRWRQIIRNSTNTGSSRAVGVGLTHALKHGFDWTWILDADSVPEPDALENLLGFSSACLARNRIT
jgi:GT2 family glycosyltransferase